MINENGELTMICLKYKTIEIRQKISADEKLTKLFITEKIFDILTEED